MFPTEYDMDTVHNMLTERKIFLKYNRGYSWRCFSGCFKQFFLINIIPKNIV